MSDVNIFGHAGPANVPDGIEARLRQGNEGQLLTSRLHGTHYEANKRGVVFIANTTPLGLAIPIYTATAPTVMLWNPAGNTKNAVLLRYTAAYASGTSVAGAIGLSKIYNAGSSIATANVISAFAETVLGSGLAAGYLNTGQKNTVRVSIAGTNTITAGVANDFFYTIAGESALVATTAMNPYTVSHDFEGAVIVPPNVAIWVSASAASGALLSQMLMWEEVAI